jgi:hypothetical protein
MTHIPETLVGYVLLGVEPVSVTMNYRTETIVRRGVADAVVAFGVGDLVQADLAGRLQRATLATTPVTTSTSYSQIQSYNLKVPSTAGSYCEGEEGEKWYIVPWVSGPADCYALVTEVREVVSTDILQTPNTFGIVLELALTGAEIATAGQSGFIDLNFKGNGPVVISDARLAFKTTGEADDVDDTPAPVPLPASVAMLALGLACLAAPRHRWAPGSGGRARAPL